MTDQPLVTGTPVRVVARVELAQQVEHAGAVRLREVCVGMPDTGMVERVAERAVNLLQRTR